MLALNLCDAIQKARGCHLDHGFHYAVIQRKGNILKVVPHSRATKGRQHVAYTTHSDRYHTVLPEVR